MKFVLLILLALPHSLFSQKSYDDLTMADIQPIYESLPRIEGKIVYHDVVKLDSTYTINILKNNFYVIFSQVLSNSRNVDSLISPKECRYSALTTFSLYGGEQNTIFGTVNELREVDYNIDISIKEREYSYTISEINTVKTRTHERRNLGNQTSVEQIDLDKAFLLCSKSSSKKMERQLFYRTVKKMAETVRLIKIDMERQSGQQTTITSTN